MTKASGVSESRESRSLGSLGVLGVSGVSGVSESQTVNCTIALFASREREGKLKITFPFYGKGTGIRKLLREGKGNLRLVIPGIPGNPGNHIKSKIKFKIISMP